MKVCHVEGGEKGGRKGSSKYREGACGRQGTLPAL